MTSVGGESMSNDDLMTAVFKLEGEQVYGLVVKGLEEGVSAKEILRTCQSGMKIVGDLYAKEEYFVADLMSAGQIMRKVMKILEPHMRGTGNRTRAGTVVMGTVKGDIHDLGKEVVIVTLQANGFEVIDLGVDVPAERFVEAVRESEARVVGMSVFLTSCFDSVTRVVGALNKAGLRNTVKIMVGGAPVTGIVAEQTGCDFFGEDAASGVNFALKVVGA
jgi:methylmalonyl-CoA mutase cobalamin-binding domain/chain